MAPKLTIVSAARLLCFPLAIELGLYGVFTALFISALMILHQHQWHAYWVNLTTTILLFGFATGAIVVGIIFQAMSLRDTVLENSPDLHTKLDPLVASSVLYSIANLITEVILIYRCYVIWNRRKSIIVPCVLLTLGNTLLPAFLVSDLRFWSVAFTDAQEMSLAISLTVNIASNLLVTSLTAGRIWWVTRQARGLIESETMKKYMIIMAIIIESGILYPLALVPFVVILLMGTKALLLPALVQIVGIVPTLKIVRVGFGINDENMSTVVASLGQSNQSRNLSVTAPDISLPTSYISRRADMELSVIEDGRRVEAPQADEVHMSYKLARNG